MKLHRLLPSEAEHELIASFGAARLVKTLAGKLELRGGTEEDRVQVREWVRTFLTQPDGRVSLVAGRSELPHRG